MRADEREIARRLYTPPASDLIKDLTDLGDGLAEELLNRLPQADGIKTIGRTSSFLLAAHDLTISEIAGKLKAELLVEGNIRMQGVPVLSCVSLLDPLSCHPHRAVTASA